MGLHVYVSITFAANPANPSPSLGAPVGFSLGVSGACVGFCGVAGLASPRMLHLGWGGTERGPGDIQDGSDVGPLAGSSGSSVAGATPVRACDRRGSGFVSGSSSGSAVERQFDPKVPSILRVGVSFGRVTHHACREISQWTSTKTVLLCRKET